MAGVKVQLANGKAAYNTAKMVTFCANNTDACIDACCQFWGFNLAFTPEDYAVDAETGRLSFEEGTLNVIAAFGLSCPLPLFPGTDSPGNIALGRPGNAQWELIGYELLSGHTVTFFTQDDNLNCPPNGYEGEAPENTWDRGIADDARSALMMFFACCTDFGTMPDTIKINNLIGNFVTSQAVSSSSYPDWDGTLTKHPTLPDLWGNATFPLRILTLDGKYLEVFSDYNISLGLNNIYTSHPTFIEKIFNLPIVGGASWEAPCGPWNSIMPPLQSSRMSVMPVITVGAP